MRSVPTIRSLFIVDLSINEGNVKVGRTLANKPSFLRINNKPCSGRTGAFGSLSYLGSPIAPNKMASAAIQISWVESGYGSPTASIAQAPVIAEVQLIS